MTPIAWIVRHKDDEPGHPPRVHFTEDEALRHAAEFLPGVCAVAPLVDGIEACRRIAELEAGLVSALRSIQFENRPYRPWHGLARQIMEKQ